MGDFFTAPAGTPLPPPEPDIPPPNFDQLAANIGIGLQNAGVIGGWVNSLWNLFVRALTYTVGFVLWVLIKAFTYFIKVLGDVTTDAQSAYGGLVAGTIYELFGVTVNPSDVSTRTGNAGRQAAATAMAQALIGTLFQGAQAVAGGGVVPSSAAADSFLAATMKMEVNGWIESWVTDGVSGHLLEKFGDLKDGIARVLGLGRLSRQVFRAPLKILVSDPYTELLNQKYRPKQWEVAPLMAQLNRGSIGRPDLSTPLGNLGYTEAQIDELVIAHQKTLSVGDLDYLDRRGLALGDFVQQQLIAQGYTEGAADSLIALLRDKRLQKYRDEMVSVGETAYVAGNIGPDTFSTILGQSGLSDEEQQWIQQVATLKIQVKVRHFTEGEIETGILDGILSFDDLKTWAIREGMSPTDEALLELEVQFKQNKQTALAKAKAATAAAKVTAANAKLQLAQQKAASVKLQAADAGLTAAQAATLVKDGIWTTPQYSAFLVSRGFGPDAVQSNLELLQAQMNATAAKATAATTTRASAAAKGLNLAQTEKAVVEGLLTTDQLQTYLLGHGYTAADAQIIVDLTQNELTAAQVKRDTAAAAKAKLATKSISLPDLDRAVRLGLTSIDTYTAALQKAGFDAASTTLLTGILQSQIVTDKAAAAKSAAATTAAAAKGITLPQLEQEVINGIRPIADYTAALLSLGYDAADQQQLTALLQLKVDQAASTAAKRAAASSALAAKGISLADAERAVKLGIVPISTYQSLLQSLHYTPDAIDVLSNTLLAQMAATKKAQTAATAASGALATKSISLPDLEKAVIAGIQPIQTYVTTLTNNGYSAADAATLQQLLQLKVDQAARAKTAHADAEGLATQKGISLGSEEAAVVAGDKTMDDYDALLIALGYDDVDRATLEQLLQTKVAAAAAKAGTAAPAAPADGTTTGTP